MKKITKTTFKSFIKKNADNLLIQVKSEFDGMVDGCVSVKGGFVKAQAADRYTENTYGIHGAWLVGGGRDWFTEYNKDGITGIEVTNCCGRFIVGVTA